MFKHKKTFFAVLLAVLMVSATAFAHSGRTDSSGGHRDNKNVSGLGSYHYHHGYPAHLHPNGVCPYSSASVSSSSNSSGSSTGSKPAASTPAPASSAPAQTTPANNMYAVRNTMTVWVNGQRLTADNFLYNGTTYVPIRAVADALNGVIYYVDATKTATITTNTATNADYKALYEKEAAKADTYFYLYEIQNSGGNLVKMFYAMTPTLFDNMDKETAKSLISDSKSLLNSAVALKNEIYNKGETTLYASADALEDLCHYLEDYFDALYDLAVNSDDTVYDDYGSHLKIINRCDSILSDSIYSCYLSLKN